MRAKQASFDVYIRLFHVLIEFESLVLVCRLLVALSSSSCSAWEFNCICNFNYIEMEFKCELLPSSSSTHKVAIKRTRPKLDIDQLTNKKKGKRIRKELLDLHESRRECQCCVLSSIFLHLRLASIEVPSMEFKKEKSTT